jgi:hypothetical protein
MYISNTAHDDRVRGIQIAGGLETFDGGLIFTGLELHRPKSVPNH